MGFLRREKDWNYCNSGYLLLGLIVEKVSGQILWRVFAGILFQAAGHESIRGASKREVSLKAKTLGYSKGLFGYKRANNWDMSWAGGAGALYSTTGDLHRWNVGTLQRQGVERMTVFGRHSLRQP